MRPPAPPRRPGRVHRVVGEPTFRSHGHRDAGRTVNRRHRLAAGVGEPPHRRQLGRAAVIIPVRQRSEFHEHVAAALLARLDHRPFEFVEPRLPRVDDAPPRPQRHEPRHAEFGEFFEQEVAAVGLRQRGGDLQPEAEFPVRRPAAGNVNRDLLFVDVGDDGRVLGPVSVEQADGVPRPGADDDGEVVRLRPVQHDRTDGERPVHVEPVRHGPAGR
jgi:hypothetical protein